MSDRRKRGRWVWAVAGIALVAPIIGFTAANAATGHVGASAHQPTAYPVPISKAPPVPISGHATPVPISKATPARNR